MRIGGGPERDDADRQRWHRRRLSARAIFSDIDLGFFLSRFCCTVGVLFFSERLDGASMLGIALLAVAGILVIRRRDGILSSETAERLSPNVTFATHKRAQEDGT